MQNLNPRWQSLLKFGIVVASVVTLGLLIVTVLGVESVPATPAQAVLPLSNLGAAVISTTPASNASGNTTIAASTAPSTTAASTATPTALTGSNPRFNPATATALTKFLQDRANYQNTERAINASRVPATKLSPAQITAKALTYAVIRLTFQPIPDTGIVQGEEGQNPGHHFFIVNHLTKTAGGITYLISAGLDEEGFDGVVDVRSWEHGSNQDNIIDAAYYPPTISKQLSIVAENNLKLTLQSADGLTFVFDVVSGKFIAGPGVSATPIIVTAPGPITTVTSDQTTVVVTPTAMSDIPTVTAATSSGVATTVRSSSAGNTVQPQALSTPHP